MGKIGKISTIKKERSTAGMQTMDTGLSQKGLTRMPGTAVFKYPYKELDGRYRTGLDHEAAYIKRIQDKTERELEIKRVKELRERLQSALGDIDLGPRANFWNYGKSLSNDDLSHVQPAKLVDGDNLFDLSNPLVELQFSWLRVHPTIASSYQAWERGEYPADTQFYVVDDDIENAVTFKKKQLINKAISKFDAMTPDRKKKVARLLGMPVSDNTKEEVVYNMVDDLLKQSEFKTGEFRGFSTVEVFNRFADMKDNLLHIKDLVKQAIAHSIYRATPGGKMMEGALEVADSEESLVKYLADEDHQEDLAALEQKVKAKKLMKT